MKNLLILPLLVCLGETTLLKKQNHEGIPQETSDSFTSSIALKYGDDGTGRSDPVVIMIDEYTDEELPMATARIGDHIQFDEYTDEEVPMATAHIGDHIQYTVDEEVPMATARIGDHIQFSENNLNDAKCGHYYGQRHIYDAVDIYCKDCHNLSRDPKDGELCRENCFTTAHFTKCVCIVDNKCHRFYKLMTLISMLQDNDQKLEQGPLPPPPTKEQLAAASKGPWRPDLRCGPKYPYIDGTNVSQCNPEGKFYCCNPRTGWCGNTAKHCSCKGCIDYRSPYPWRLDLRCGKRYLNILGEGAICNRGSSNPCCNTKTGYCGWTKKHCECKGCLDYRDTEQWRKDLRCGPNYPTVEEPISICNYKWGNNPCCSPTGWCGKSPQHCTAKGAIDYRQTYRSDSRCGPKFPLHGKHRKDEPSECDPRSDAPCCSASGWCGQEPVHCDCPTCINYKARYQDRFRGRSGLYPSIPEPIWNMWYGGQKGHMDYTPRDMWYGGQQGHRDYTPRDMWYGGQQGPL